MHEKASKPKEETGETVTPERNPGEIFLRKIGELPESYHISAEQKALFSTVSNVPDLSGFPVDVTRNGVFTTFGFEYDGKRYPYTPEYRALAHRAAVKACFRESEDFPTFESNLQSANQHWQDAIYSVYLRPAKSLAREEYSRIRDEKTDQISNLQKDNLARNTAYVEVAEKAVELGLLNQETADEFLDFKKARNSLLEDFRKKAHDLYPNINERPRRREITRAANDFAYQAKERLHDYLDEITLNAASQIEDSFIKDKIKERTTRARSKYSSYHYNIDVASMKTRLFDTLKRYNLQDDPDLIEIIERSRRLTEKDSEVNAPAFFSASLKAISPNEDEIGQIEKEKNHFRNQREDFISGLAEKNIAEFIQTFKTRAAKTIFPDSDMSELYFLPTGAILRDSEGGFMASTFSPMDERILALFNDENAEQAWVNTWRNHSHDYDHAVRKSLCESLNDERTEKSASLYDEFDKKIYNFSQEFQFDLPRVFDPHTGKVFESLQPHDLEILSEIMPRVGSFINHVELSPADEPTLKSTRLEILGFLSGDSELSDSTLFAPDRKLKVRALEALLNNAGPEKQEKVAARLVPELAIAVYNSLEPGIRKEFSQLLGPRANVSRTEFYRVYRKSVSDPKIRRKYAERTFFLMEFQKYLRSESTPAFTDFFDRQKKLPGLASKLNWGND